MVAAIPLPIAERENAVVRGPSAYELHPDERVVSTHAAAMRVIRIHGTRTRAQSYQAAFIIAINARWISAFPPWSNFETRENGSWLVFCVSVTKKRTYVGLTGDLILTNEAIYRTIEGH